MAFDLAFWRKATAAPTELASASSAQDGRELGEAVHRMVEARLGTLRAVLETRAAYLKAQALTTDSRGLRAELAARASELEFVLQNLGAEPPKET